MIRNGWVLKSFSVGSLVVEDAIPNGPVHRKGQGIYRYRNPLYYYVRKIWAIVSGINKNKLCVHTTYTG